MSSFTYTANYTYDGPESRAWYSEVINGAPSLPLLGIMPRVKYKMNVPKLDVSNVFKARACKFDNSGSIDMTTRQIEVTALDINLDICQTELESIGISERMIAGNNVEEWLPDDLREKLLELIAEKATEQVEFLIWQGDTTSLTPELSWIDGLEKKLAADTNVISVTGTTLSSANILTEASKVIAAIPAPMLRKRTMDRVGIALNQTSYQMLIDGLAAQTFNPGLNIDIPPQIVYKGWKFYPLDGISDDTMVFGDFTRFWVGTDLETDFTNLRIINMYLQEGSREYRILGGCKLGVQYAVSGEVVYYA